MVQESSNIDVISICRWRDVKLRAFDNAKHRTYVDLKVKQTKQYLILPLIL